jgi:hypothetical protein
MKVVIISVLLSYILLGVTDKKEVKEKIRVRDESLYRSNKGVESIYLINDIEDELPGRV